MASEPVPEGMVSVSHSSQSSHSADRDQLPVPAFDLMSVVVVTVQSSPAWSVSVEESGPVAVTLNPTRYVRSEPEDATMGDDDSHEIDPRPDTDALPSVVMDREGSSGGMTTVPTRYEVFAPAMSPPAVSVSARRTTVVATYQPAVYPTAFALVAEPVVPLTTFRALFAESLRGVGNVTS